MDIKTIKHIASLARIKLTGAEEETMRDELSSILGYIEQLNKVDTKGIEPLYQVTGSVNSFRTDENRGDFKISEELSEKLIGQAPRKEKRFIKVGSILKK